LKKVIVRESNAKGIVLKKGAVLPKQDKGVAFRSILMNEPPTNLVLVEDCSINDVVIC